MSSSRIEKEPLIESIRHRSEFPTTHWSLVTRVREGGEFRKAALEELCHQYWYPIYAFLRRRGHSQHDAQDITQAFFVKLIQNASFDAADSNRGRLRTYLLAALGRHLADEQRHRSALKRGGGQIILAFEDLQAEERYTLEPTDAHDPEWLFARTWARSLLDDVRQKLRMTFEEAGRNNVFEELLPFLLSDHPPPSYRSVAEKLDSSETAVRLLVFRTRKRFRELLREEVSRTVLHPDSIEEEMEWIKTVLSSS